MHGLKFPLRRVRVELVLSRQGLRNLMVHALELENKPRKPRKSDVLAVIRHLGQLQIDTIHVVARSPYLVLFSRLGAYPNEWLDQTLAEGDLFEGWAHAACFLPREDYPLHRGLALARGTEDGYPVEWVRNNQLSLERVLQHVRENGETRSVEFERQDGRKGAWWDWKIEKQALEYWLSRGDLMVRRRENFQRVYDLRDRVMPDWREELAAQPEEAEKALALQAVRALGAVKIEWVADYFRRPKTATLRALKTLIGEGSLREVRVEGWDRPLYYHADRLELVEEAAANRLSCRRTVILSPFDPLTWDRQRGREVFGFDYTIECYTPAARRKYGYFSLPILRRGQLIGRLDAKAHRKEGRFEVKGLFLEEGVRVNASLAADLARALQALADWHTTPRVEIGGSQPQELKALLGASLAVQAGG